MNLSKLSKKQIQFCCSIGIETANCTPTIVYAKLMDWIDKNFWGKANLGKPTEKQIELAKIFGYDIKYASRRVSFATIDEIMTQLNLNSIKSQNLKPGDKVKHKRDKIGVIYTISSITEDGLIYFKGGQGKKAWARNLKKPN